MSWTYQRQFFFILLFIICQGIFNSASSGQCYVTSGRSWKVKTVTYRVNSDIGDLFTNTATYKSIIKQAADKWNAAGSDFRFVEGENTTDAKDHEQTGTFQVYKYKDYFDLKIAYTKTDLTPKR